MEKRSKTRWMGRIQFILNNLTFQDLPLFELVDNHRVNSVICIDLCVFAKNLKKNNVDNTLVYCPINWTIKTI